MWFLTYILANVKGRITRSLLTVSGVAVAVAAVVSLVGIVRGFEASLLELYDRQGIDLMVSQSGRVQLTSSVLAESLADEIARLDGVAQAYPSLIDALSLDDGDMMGVVIQGWPVSSQPLRSLELTEGQPLSDSGPPAVLMGRRLAEAMGKSVGDSVELLDGEPFSVAGIFDSYNVFESGSMVTRLADLQQLLLRDGDITLVGVVAADRDPESVAKLRQRIEDLHPGIDANPVRELAESSTEIRMARAFAWLTSTIALLIGSIGMLNTMMMAVFERTREIAMLRALGWRRRRIIALVLGEASVLCAAGAAVGIVAAVVLVDTLSKMPEAGRLVAGDISTAVMLQGLSLALALGVLGGLYPAWAAARMAPVDGLRHD